MALYPRSTTVTHRLAGRSSAPHLEAVGFDGPYTWMKVDGDEKLTRFFDIKAGYASNPFGNDAEFAAAAADAFHNAPAVLTAAVKYQPVNDFVERLTLLMDQDMALIKSTGSEAVESMLHAMRRWFYSDRKYEEHSLPENDAQIIVTHNNFHGRTNIARALSNNGFMRDGCGPFPQVAFISGEETDEEIARKIEGAAYISVPFGNDVILQKVITAKTAGIMIEPIQGEAGVIEPPEGYLKKVEKICQENNILFALDEIQTGCGRTGTWLASQLYGVRPDLLAISKIPGGGKEAFSAVLGSEDVLGRIKPGQDSSTRAFSPAACAVANVVLDWIEQRDLLRNSAEIGAFIKDGLREVLGADGNPSPVICDVRGQGLLIGLEINPDFCTGDRFVELLAHTDVKGPDGNPVRLMCEATHGSGKDYMLNQTIRISPPLNTPKELAKTIIDAVQAVALIVEQEKQAGLGDTGVLTQREGQLTTQQGLTQVAA